MAGKGGGAWKVAYADFVTAMMAFFMVMWLLSQNDKVKHAVASHFRNPYGEFAVGDSLLPPKYKQHFRDRPQSGEDGSTPDSPHSEGQKTRKPYTILLHRGDRSIVGAMITVPENSTELTEAAREQLRGLVPLMDGKPQKIEICGHATRQPPGDNSLPDAWQLSYARCMNTMNFLVSLGIAPERIRLSQAGPYEPYTLGDDPKQVPLNSRIEVFMLNEVAEEAIGTQEERLKRFRGEEDESTDSQLGMTTSGKPERAAH